MVDWDRASSTIPFLGRIQLCQRHDVGLRADQLAARSKMAARSNTQQDVHVTVTEVISGPVTEVESSTVQLQLL